MINWRTKEYIICLAHFIFIVANIEVLELLLRQASLFLHSTANGDIQASFALVFFFKFYFIFKLYIIVLVLPNIKMNPPQVYMCSPS